MNIVMHAHEYIKSLAVNRMLHGHIRRQYANLKRLLMVTNEFSFFNAIFIIYKEENTA